MLRTLGTLTWFGPRLYVSSAARVFDAEGRIVDETVRASLAKYLAGFSHFLARVARPTESPPS